MDQVSRPMLIAFVAVVAFAAVWLVALRPKSPDAPSGQPAPAAQPAPAEKPKSALPGALGGAVDQARAAKADGDAAAGARPGQVDAAAGDSPAATQAAPAPPAAAAAPAARERVTRAVSRAEARRPGFGTPAKVRVALARGQAVVLLFYSARSSDDRAVRGELAAVSRRGGRVKVWAVSVNGLPRFKNVLRGVQVLQTPSVVMLHRGTPPVLFAGFTDRAEIDQTAAVALRR
jgi:hypothetical protein